MRATRSFGHPSTARILAIGHDPLLQKGKAKAEVAFFFDYLLRPRPTYKPEAAKYSLAEAVWNYVNFLAGYTVPLDELYVTNLCNEFLDRGGKQGVVLIPDDKAQSGVEQITRIVASGSFRVILPMAVQTFYHLCSLKFIDEDCQLITRFMRQALPKPEKAGQGIYCQSGKAPFLDVCGLRFHHNGVPVVPIVHVKQWPLKSRFKRYQDPMLRASCEVRAALRAAL